jgi:flagellar biosynthesis protein FlhF
MRIKTLTAPHMADAVKMIREQLGAEALILSTRKVKGADGQPTLEITAAVEDNDVPPTQSKELVPAKVVEALERRATPAGRAALPEAGKGIASTLRAHGVGADLIARIEDAAVGLRASGFSDADAVEMLLGKLLAFKAPADAVTRGHAHVLLGPPGAGKTTLVAKLAINAKRMGLTVGVMSLDDQKIGGFEPLRVTADVLGDVAHLIRGPEDLAKAAKALGPKHVLLIDTPGLTPTRRGEVAQFRMRLESLRIPYVSHLVLPAPYNADDMQALPVVFGAYTPATLMVSRLDETTRFGAVATTAHAHRIPLALGSDGPDYAAAPVALSARWLAEQLARTPQQMWEAGL